MTTVQAVVDDALRKLLGGTREARNKLSGAHTGNTTSLTLTYPVSGIQAGTRVSVGLEDMFVWESSGTTATVERGQFGSTAAAHSDGAIVFVNPRFSQFDVLEAINDELAALSGPNAGLYQMSTKDITYNSSTVGYDLVAAFLDVHEIRYGTSAGEENWRLVTRYTVSRNLPTTDFASGTAIFFEEPIEPGRTVRVRYKSAFTALSGLADNVETVSGIHTEATDILALGAAIRLMAGREVARNFYDTQGDTRRAEEVPPGAQINAMRGLLAIYDRRVREERARLAQRYPPRLKVRG